MSDENGASDSLTLRVGEFEGPPGPWVLCIAWGEYAGLTAALTFVTSDHVYYWKGFTTLADAKRHFEPTYFGRAVGDWRAVPDDVSTDRAQTIDWLLAQARGASAR